MSKFALMFSLVLLLSASSLPPRAFEGTITFSIAYPELGEGMAGMVSMLPTMQEWKVKGNKLRMSQQSMGGEQIIIVNQATGKGYVLLNIMGNKLALETTANDQELIGLSGTSVELTKDSKKIAGYNCKKAIIINDSAENVVYYTPDFANPVANDNSRLQQFPGLPLYLKTTQQGTTIELTAQEVKEESVSDALFEIPAGYTITSQDELIEIMQQMGR
ncbi:hypothetical protein GC194_00550 [bacterium]|nr:hypothetical protein [bacterium]